VAGTVGYAWVGAGLVGPTHARFAAQAKGAQLGVVCDLREDPGRPVAEELGAEWVVDDWALMGRDDVQLVSTCLQAVVPYLQVERPAARRPAPAGRAARS
jgi:predicted dehydrogenase